MPDNPALARLRAHIDAFGISLVASQLVPQMINPSGVPHTVVMCLSPEMAALAAWLEAPLAEQDGTGQGLLRLPGADAFMQAWISRLRELSARGLSASAILKDDRAVAATVIGLRPQPQRGPDQMEGGGVWSGPLSDAGWQELGVLQAQLGSGLVNAGAQGIAVDQRAHHGGGLQERQGQLDDVGVAKVGGFLSDLQGAVDHLLDVCARGGDGCVRERGEVRVNGVDVGDVVAVQHVVEVRQLVLELVVEGLFGQGADRRGLLLGGGLVDRGTELVRVGPAGLLQLPTQLLALLVAAGDEGIDGGISVVDEPVDGVRVVEDVADHRCRFEGEAALGEQQDGLGGTADQTPPAVDRAEHPHLVGRHPHAVGDGRVGGLEEAGGRRPGAVGGLLVVRKGRHTEDSRAAWRASRSV